MGRIKKWIIGSTEIKEVEKESGMGFDPIMRIPP
jgi:hypothetical protein